MDTLILLLGFAAIGLLFHQHYTALALAGGYGVFSRKKNQFAVFSAAFLAMALCWLAVAAYIDFQNEQILSQRIADLFRLSGSLPLLLVTAVIGGLMAGVAALGASALSRLLTGYGEGGRDGGMAEWRND